MAKKTILHQHGTLGALMAGLMDGTTTINQLLSLGNFGIGTLHGLDGELIILDQQAYQGKSDGTLVKLTGEELVPYAAVTEFISEKQVTIDHPMTSQEMTDFLEKQMMSRNIFNSIKITGTFNHMHIRIMPKQERPYKRLVEVSKNQPEFQQEHVTGTIVGFYTPELFQGVAAAGFHLHFLSEDQQFGGHILDYQLTNGTVELAAITELNQHFPMNNQEFLENDIDYADLANEIRLAES